MTAPAPEHPGDHLPGLHDFAGWSACGRHAVSIVAGPVHVRVTGAGAEEAASLERWSGAAAVSDPAPAEPPELTLELTRSPRACWLTPRPGEPTRLTAWAEASGALAMASHHVALLADGDVDRGIVVLTEQDDAALEASLQNAVRVAVAWRLALTGRGLMVHAAAFAQDDVAVLLLGRHGAGKTTAARHAAPRAVLADDLAVLEAPATPGAAWQVHPSPFFAEADFPGRRSRGRPLPLALACSLRRATSAAFERVPRSRGSVLLAAHAPFLTEPPGVFDVARPAADLARATPVGILATPPDATYWSVLTPLLDELRAPTRGSGSSRPAVLE